jgi:hypothetical protein
MVGFTTTCGNQCLSPLTIGSQPRRPVLTSCSPDDAAICLYAQATVTFYNYTRGIWLEKGLFWLETNKMAEENVKFPHR